MLFRISSWPLWRKLLLFAACIVLLSAYLAAGARRWLASRYARQPELASLQRAGALDPSNAECHDRLGHFVHAAKGPLEAVEEYLSAVSLNPHAARYWLDLAEAYRAIGAVQQQMHALERVIASDPATPDIAWEVGNFYLLSGDTPHDLQQFRGIIWTAPWMRRQALLAHVGCPTDNQDWHVIFPRWGRLMIPLRGWRLQAGDVCARI